MLKHILISIAVTRFLKSYYFDRQLILSFRAPERLASASKALRLGRTPRRLPEKSLRDHLAVISVKTLM